MRGCRRKSRSSATYLVDTCGTGGSGASKLFNISTAAAFVAAAAGAHVAKHGNRGMTSKSGSADVLEAAGVNLNLTPAQIGRCVREVGVGFMFAPAHHRALKHAAAARQGTRHADDLQSGGAADESGVGAESGDRGLRAGTDGNARAGAATARQPSRHAGARRRARRAVDRGAVARSSNCATARSPTSGSRRSDFGIDVTALDGLYADSPRASLTLRQPVSRASPIRPRHRSSR